MNTEFPESEFLDLLVGLMVTPGPSLGEEPRRRFIEAWFEASGLTCGTDAAGNVLACYGTGEPGETVIFDAHIDVVEKGFCATPRVDNEAIHGLGSGDNLVAVAMLMLLAVVWHGIGQLARYSSCLAWARKASEI